MSIKKLEKKQSEILRQLSQQLKKSDFNKVCRAIEFEHKIAVQVNQ